MFSNQIFRMRNDLLQDRIINSFPLVCQQQNISPLPKENTELGKKLPPFPNGKEGV
ncbi:hypothetical protein [Neobacillus niacini]|uniref:hypothetical protein n=1 Tax=Neobacillus niacini TaxID=86668 RepID=UPI002860F363|nr:hypothetical protein [Neobacillus niacini]MDR6998435.1 hypothetical protein [Neobacillus niacini]